MVTKDTKTGGAMRNQLCVCGSDKKFKKCCWSRHNVAGRLTVLGVKDMIKTVRYKMLKQFRDTGILPNADKSRRILSEAQNELS